MGDHAVAVIFDRAHAPARIGKLSTATIVSEVDRRLVEQNAGQGRGKVLLNRNSAGYGAFRRARYQTSGSCMLERNGSRWRGRAKLPRMIVRRMSEASTRRLRSSAGGRTSRAT